MLLMIKFVDVLISVYVSFKIELNDSGMNNCVDEILYFCDYFCMIGIMIVIIGVLFKNVFIIVIGIINCSCVFVAFFGVFKVLFM